MNAIQIISLVIISTVIIVLAVSVASLFKNNEYYM